MVSIEIEGAISMSNLSLERQIYRLHLAFVRKINDTHIFVRQSFPLLEEAKNSYKTSAHKNDRSYYVPTVGREKFAKRTDQELREIYGRFISRELYENLIVTAVSQFESFLFDALRIILLAYPQKLKISIRGNESKKDVPIDLLLEADSIEDVLKEVIERQLNSLSFAAPREYLGYLNNVASVNTEDDAFLDYIEIKATRDILIHNAGVVNEIYVAKSGAKKRGAIGDKLLIDLRYFEHCVAILKRLSGIIYRDVKKTFPDNSKSKKM